jgi:arabinan endo-1,5-alpha-L-arabinosidase
MKVNLVLVLLAAFISSCAKPLLSLSSHKQLMLDRDFPDPTVIQADDGFYYAYATQSPNDNGGVTNLQIARSKDLTTWKFVGEGLPTKPSWASNTQDIWAPHVSHPAGGKYILYYSANPNAKTGLCLGVATSDSPMGPFIDTGAPLVCGKSFVNIDPMQFDDPKTGEPYLIWGSGFEPVRIQKLAGDHLRFAPGSASTELIFPVASDNPENYQRLVEGAWMLENEGWYYLFFSGDNCCTPNPHYGVMVARSRSVLGPFENFEGGVGLNKNVIVAEDSRWSAPGHNSVIKDGEGNHWVFYHGIDRQAPYLKSSVFGDHAVRRPMLKSSLTFRNGWPEVQ